MAVFCDSAAGKRSRESADAVRTQRAARYRPHGDRPSAANVRSESAIRRGLSPGRSRGLGPGRSRGRSPGLGRGRCRGLSPGLGRRFGWGRRAGRGLRAFAGLEREAIPAGVVPPEITALVGTGRVEARAQFVGERAQRTIVVRPLGDRIVGLDGCDGVDRQTRQGRGEDVLAPPKGVDEMREALQVGNPPLVGGFTRPGPWPGEERRDDDDDSSGGADQSAGEQAT
jgi:hypothetical protein